MKRLLLFLGPIYSLTATVTAGLTLASKTASDKIINNVFSESALKYLNFNTSTSSLMN